ncbi:SGNH/GDSL hydrolase family protein [Streptomyces abyssomicinicus]|uniref:SGNH/GDSL hydrolase family protein n=1 Tax=Streptomyces abyssomicinicus TaxID=574929 RepID=UPI00125054EA|nr:SGNH/GDSL hydrolase family protein [Streptomyces abyssomicinicus]
MTRRHACALLAAFTALIIAVSAGIYLVARQASARPEARDTSLSGGRVPHNPAAPASTGTWVGSWAAAPSGAEPGTELTGIAGRSVRNIVHTSAGGSAARVTLSNHYGQLPLRITSASVGVAAQDNAAEAVPDTLRPLTFSGAPAVTVPPGGQVVSDAVALRVHADSDLLVTTYSPTPSGPVTYHRHARQISYVATGDHVLDPRALAYTEPTPHWRYVTAVDVLSKDSRGTVVVIGDSLTDGITSTTGQDARWTDVLAERLDFRHGVANAGISGNQLLTDGLGRPADSPSGLNRFERDALSRPNTKAVVVVLGINDILRDPDGTPDPAAVTAGLRSLVSRAHARGVPVVGATLMPFEGHAGYDAVRESARQAVNTEIRRGEIFDAVLDLDAALRDPYAPHRLAGHLDSGDHLHLNDAGYRRMAQRFDTSVLSRGTTATL